MIDFEYVNPARIIFGEKPYGRIAEHLKEYNVHSLLMIYSGEFVKTLGIYQEVEKICNEQNITFISNGNVVPNPKVELVRELIETGRENRTDFILAVGGGSSVDTAKAVALGMNYNGDVWDFFEGKAEPDTVLPVGVISTIPASGSETSNAAIISNGINKLGFESEKIIPKFAVMNPHYTRTLPAYQSACGISDILSHLLERYWTNTEHVDTTDYLIEGAVKAVMLNGERIMKNPDDYDARAEIQWLAYVKYCAKKHPKKMAQFANRVFNIDYYNYTEEEMVLLLAERLEQFYKKLNLKTTLTEMHIDKTHFTEMADRATKNNTSPVGHYYPLDKERIIEVLNIAL